MKTGQVMQQFGIKRDTLRFYTEQGLLQPQLIDGNYYWNLLERRRNQQPRKYTRTSPVRPICESYYPYQRPSRHQMRQSRTAKRKQTGHTG